MKKTVSITALLLNSLAGVSQTHYECAFKSILLHNTKNTTNGEP